MWGTFLHISTNLGYFRFIPTYVGNIVCGVCCAWPVAVHPHVCGEHIISNVYDVCKCGSSPRMWGTCSHSSRANTDYRFIPTYVGNMNLSSTGMKSVSVHPHVCGEHAFMSLANLAVLRFIPTYVGNIRRLFPQETAHTVHPHVCGEHGGRGDRTSRENGSSPRMWGTSLSRSRSFVSNRFIPTYVGNMDFCRLSHAAASVHPHVCGEHVICCVSGPCVGRFIPTYVGNMLYSAPAAVG